MKYRNISLNGNKDKRFSLIKYTDEYKKYLEELKEMNRDLAYYVEKLPKICDETSECQSYMIFQDEIYCVGAIFLKPSYDNKSLEIKMQFNEKNFKTKNDIFKVVEQVVESLGLYFFDKENIEIDLINDIDLSQFNSVKHRKRNYEKLTTYNYSNKRNNTLIPSLIAEISETEKNLISWKQSWTQEFYDYDDWSSLIDSELINSYENGTVSLQELFYKVGCLSWVDINSANSTRMIEFFRSGKIKFDKFTKKDEGIDYKISYNVLDEYFSLEARNVLEKTLEICSDSYSSNIKVDNIAISYIKEYKRKKVSYVSPVINNSSIALELWFDKQNELENCYVDFRTHKKNGKINGLYALRIRLGYFRSCWLKFISRKGYRGFDFFDALFRYNQELYSKVKEGKLTIDLIDEMIKKFIFIINGTRNSSKQTKICENSFTVARIMSVEHQAIQFINRIQREMPLPHLQENLEKFIDEFKVNKIDYKKRILKN